MRAVSQRVMKKHLSQTILENGIYALIWLVVLAVPLFGYHDGDGIQWPAVIHFWLGTLPFAGLFVLNNYILMPMLMLRKRYGWYVVCTLLAIVILFIVIPLSTGVPKVHLFCKAAADSVCVNDTMHEVLYGYPVELHGHEGFAPMPPHPPKGGMVDMPIRLLPVKWEMLINRTLIAILILGCNIAIKLLFRSMRDARYLREVESQRLKAELRYLKAQVNPHFFMNTLNNIHALIDIDTEKAKEAVIELSKIMRYVLYDADRQTVSLQKEIDFIDNYIRLMRLRYSDDVEISTEYPARLPDVQVPPLALVTLTENAFKHGISYRTDSFVHTVLEVGDGFIVYTVSNSISDCAAGASGTAGSGVGLDNLLKRLDLLYGSNYSFEVQRTDRQYVASLRIPTEL